MELGEALLDGLEFGGELLSLSGGDGLGWDAGFAVAEQVAVVVVELEAAVGVAGDGDAAFVDEAVAVPAAQQDAAVEVGVSVVGGPAVEVV